MDQYFWKHDKNELLEQLPKTTQRHIKYKPIQKKKKSFKFNRSQACM